MLNKNSRAQVKCNIIIFLNFLNMKLRKKKPRPAAKREQGAANPRIKLTTHEIDLIRQYYAIGLSVKLLAAKFEISPQQVRNIVKARSRCLA